MPGDPLPGSAGRAHLHALKVLLKGLDNCVQTQKNVSAVNCPYPLLDLAVTAAFKRKRPKMVVSRK
jgi:hypothetical protein